MHAHRRTECMYTCTGQSGRAVQDMTVVAELRHRGLPMEAILRSKVHGRGGLIRRVLCGPPEAAIAAGAQPRPAAGSASPKAPKAVGSHAVSVVAVAESDED